MTDALVLVALLWAAALLSGDWYTPLVIASMCIIVREAKTKTGRNFTAKGEQQ